MDAIKYIKELNRMCDAKKECSDCYAKGTCNFPDAEKAEEAVAAVERWVREHPVVTNGEMVEKLIPRSARSISWRFSPDPILKVLVDKDWWNAEYKEER